MQAKNYNNSVISIRTLHSSVKVISVEWVLSRKYQTNVENAQRNCPRGYETRLMWNVRLMQHSNCGQTGDQADEHDPGILPTATVSDTCSSERGVRS